MLTTAVIERILDRIPRLTIGVLGDLFLDRYLDIDGALTEPSIETGLDAYQVVRVRSYPGAAGTVINNLAALGVGRICPIAVVGDDGEGYELRHALQELRVVEEHNIFSTRDRRTPTYTKPMHGTPGSPARELNRLDIKNRQPLPAAEESKVLQALEMAWPQLDALVVLDQVSEADCGVVTTSVRERLAELGEANPERLILADSRERIGKFRMVTPKVNGRELEYAVRGWGVLVELRGGGLSPVRLMTFDQMQRRFAEHFSRPVYCTLGDLGIDVLQHGAAGFTIARAPCYPVAGPIDTVGAGDSVSAGITCAVAAGASLEEAAAFGNLVASITIQQLGVTGTATPEQVRQRWREMSAYE